MVHAVVPAGLSASCPDGGCAGDRKVLIVEDYQTLQLLYAEELAEEGYDVAVCGDCATLLDMIRAHRPDIIVLDIMLGPHNTLDMLRDIHAVAQGAQVLLHSAYASNTFGAADYLVKSADIQMMKDKLRNLAGSSQEGAGPQG
jgi:two-component system response regulator BaeR